MLTSISLAIALFAANPSEWPQFRGPDGSGVLPRLAHPIEWGEGQNVTWKVAVGGAGWASPIIADGKVIVSTAVTEKQNKPKNSREGSMDIASSGLFGLKKPTDVYRFEVHCLDLATGKSLWRQLVAEQIPAIASHPSNTFATGTPTTDGSRVFTYFGSIGTLVCHDLNGSEVWRKDVGAFTMAAGFGSGSSPVVSDGRLYVKCDNEESSFLVALDPATGDELWRVARDCKSSWATPVVWRNAERTELVAGGNGIVTSHDPETGKQLWKMTKIVGSLSASPTGDRDRLIFGTSGPTTNAPIYSVKAGAADDITLAKGETSNAAVTWHRVRSGLGLATPILYDGILYVVGGSILTCFDPSTGEQLYKERLPGAAQITASPWAADGKVFILDEDGKTFVLEAGRTFNVLRTNELEDTFWASPSVAGDSLLLRGAAHIYCIRQP